MNKNLRNKILRLTRDLKELPTGKSKHFSFIIERNTVLSVGFNSYKTHPLSHKLGYKWQTLHSEIDAIIKFKQPTIYLPRYTFVNTRINRAGEITMSRPCANCIRTLDHFGIQTVWYTNYAGKFEKL